jgi:hypothetical protein
MLFQYMAYVPAHSWGKLVFETHGGGECFDFSCRPSNTIPDVPKAPHSHA